MLAQFKALGTPFNTAWANAMRTLPRKSPDYADWKKALHWARPAYQAYYEGLRLNARDDGPDATTLACLRDPVADTVDALLGLDQPGSLKDGEPVKSDTGRTVLAA